MIDNPPLRAHHVLLSWLRSFRPITTIVAPSTGDRNKTRDCSIRDERVLQNFLFERLRLGTQCKNVAHHNHLVLVKTNFFILNEIQLLVNREGGDDQKN